MPKKQQTEFWNDMRIAHIRDLALTGRPSKLWHYDGPGRRILDRTTLWSPTVSLVGRDLNSVNTEDIDTSVDMAFGQIRLAAPMYLGDMSFGALSGIPNISLAKAADQTGVITGTGEGGLNEEVAKCKRITVQWASARFGVNKKVLNSGLGIVIKIGQGAKPGIGGHLPGKKVTNAISSTRRIPSGIDAISPSPHHDIYSIEDLGQRIWALKEATGKPVFVKVGVTNYIPFIASGVARMGADGIILDGAGAGTGAAPAVVRDNVGIPIDVAVASVDRMLREQGLRRGFSIVAAGLVSSAEDSAKLIALGADVISIGTAALLALGCLMVHKCHIGFCPAYLTNMISSNPSKLLSQDKATEWVVNLVNGWNAELKQIIAGLGLRSLADLVGKREVLRGRELTHETLRILGIEPAPDAQEATSLPSQGEVWSAYRRNHLQHLAGTTGKSGGEAVIASMGSIMPALVEDPLTLCDFIRCDGAQVTRPSIDPYREEIETTIYLNRGSLRLSSPIVFSPMPAKVPTGLREIFFDVAARMGLLLDLGTETERQPRFSSLRRILYPATEANEHATNVVVDYKTAFASEVENAIVQLANRSIYLRVPCNALTLESIANLVSNHIRGVIVDWDMDTDGEEKLDLEVVVSQVDQKLRTIWTGKRVARDDLDLIAESSRIRGADDIFKIMGLGADAVGFTTGALVGLGYSDDIAWKQNGSDWGSRLEN
ncbi:MAG: glutamate synthase-related protein, partial [Candidatus Bathyarchaeia archaeon]